MKMNITKIGEKKSVLLGRVTGVYPGNGEATGKVVNVTMEGEAWDREKKTEVKKAARISFWNSDSAPMADWITSAKVSEGSIIAVDAYQKDDEQYTGNRFMYRGHWKYPEHTITTEDGEEKTIGEKNVLMGIIASLKEGETEGGQKFVRVSMPISIKDQEEPEWVSITFWESDLDNLMERAKKALSERDGKKRKAIIVCGKEKDFNGRKMYTGYDFQLY